MVLPIILLEDKHKMLLHLSIFYDYQQFFQHRICFSIQPTDYSDLWPTLARSTNLFLIMLFNERERERERVMMFNATFNNISVISWRSVLLTEQYMKESDLLLKFQNNKMKNQKYNTVGRVPKTLFNVTILVWCKYFSK